jgi:transcriptional regulator of arginine metabolism
MMHLYADGPMASSSEGTLTAARREALRQIIGQSAVGRQADLVRLLSRAGHRATQSSVSRDLRELGVAKQGDRYVLPDEAPPARDAFGAVAGFVRQVRPAGASLTVIRTAAGAAQSVAIVLDRAQWPEVVGTISGDDTIFVATEGAPGQRKLLSRLHDIFRV